MKLLYLTAEPHPTFRADVRVLFGKYLPRHGIHSDLLTQAAASELPATWPGGQALLCPPTRNKWKKQWLRFRHELRVFALAKQGYDAIQVRDRVLAGVLGLWAARRAGVPFFYWASFPKPEMRVHAASEPGPHRYVLMRVFNALRGRLSALVLYRVLLPAADHVFVQSEAMLSAFERQGIRASKMTPVPMGVDVEAVGGGDRVPHAPSAPSACRPPTLIYLGAMERIRRPDLLLEAMVLVRQSVPTAKLLMVGDSQQPGDLAALKDLAKALHIDDAVVFTGWVSAEEALEYVASADVGLSPFPRGPILDVASPTKVPEYLVHGVPVVGNDSPDQKFVLEASGGGTCCALDARAFADAIVQLLQQPEVARRQGAAGRAWVLAHRSYACIAADLANCYAGLGQARAGRTA